MTIRRSSLFLILVLVMLALSPIPALAQDGVPIDSLNVALWPEYDRPQMLVIYKILWSSDLPLPAEVTLRIPAAAGEPNAVAARELDGGLYNVAYQREVHGEWAEITFIAPSREAQLEYYDPALMKDETQRAYTYTWPGDYAVRELSFQVQQPAGAADLSVTPGLGAAAPGSDGLLYYSGGVGSVAAGEAYALDLEYQKNTDALSVEMAQVQPAEPVTDDTPGRVTMMDVLPWLLAILAVLVIVGGALWMWRKPEPAVSGSSRSRSRRRTARQAVPENKGGDEGAIYCHQCGKRAAPGDNYCRVCGTKLRGA